MPVFRVVASSPRWRPAYHIAGSDLRISGIAKAWPVVIEESGRLFPIPEHQVERGCGSARMYLETTMPPYCRATAVTTVPALGLHLPVT